jgi:hypothetical protein
MLGHGWVLADVLLAPLTAIVIIDSVPVVTGMICDPRPRTIINEGVIRIFQDDQWIF